jgi:hypothetical protein
MKLEGFRAWMREPPATMAAVLVGPPILTASIKYRII